MNKKKNKKKKGFTLIELVIVLAVLAIIAMIAIPNFTKVRNKALVDGDIRSAEQIEKITLMALANGDIPTKAVNYEIKKTTVLEVIPKTTTPSSTVDSTVDTSKYKELLRDIENPQVPGSTGYIVQVDENGAVGVGYLGEKPTFAEVKDQHLAGSLLKP